MALSSTEVSNFDTGLFDGLFREEDEERIMNQTRVSSHISEKSTIILMVKMSSLRMQRIMKMKLL